MVDIRKARIDETASIREVIQVIDQSSLQIALVVDGNGKLLGTVTDGDVRRGILRGLDFTSPVTQIMNRRPTTGMPDQPRTQLVKIMNRKMLRHIPLIDQNGILVGLELLDNYSGSEPKSTLVVIMAGGAGKRLGELTASTPKPMLNVKNKPLLESILDGLKDYGFRNIYISVNYKRDVIQDYFGSGENHGVEIKYLEEDKPLGTVGSLSLLPVKPDAPFIVMNADLVTSLNLESLLNFHTSKKSMATICIRDYEFQVPFGVVNVNEDYRVTGIEEKPKPRFFVNAGIYVLEPKCLDFIPKNEYMDMPDLLAALLRENAPVLAFPIHENWVDVGRREDFDLVNK